MKTYFLALINTDFTITGNKWISSSFDLYSNRFYTNYSTYRNIYGNNLIGDYTYTGNEILQDATPTITGADYVTEAGEVIKDQTFGQYYIFDFNAESSPYYLYDLINIATPYKILTPSETQFLPRFVDTSSPVNVLGFKHSFANLPGLEEPNFSVKIFTSKNNSTYDSEWKQVAFTDSKNNLLFLRSSERYVKFEIDFDSSSSLSSSNFLFLVQVEISDPLPPNISDHARNVLSKFPSWTKMYSDSLERATPETATPISEAGKIVSAIFNDTIDDIDTLIDSLNFDLYISSVDTREIAWLYVCTPVDPGFIKVTGDGIELGRVNSYEDLIKSNIVDYSFYYDFLSRSLYTLRPFTDLYVDQVKTDQIVTQNFNSFDEFGLRVGLTRLYLESNTNFRKRILDVYSNPPAVNAIGLKQTLRRELDIWRAYGATPDSSYLGATPEIMEISDIQSSSPYFDIDGNALPAMYSFVEEMNQRFPSNIGYARWLQTYWDYAGNKQEGVSSIPQKTDISGPQNENYQSGVGDFDDAKVTLELLDRQTAEKYFSFKVSGLKSDSTELAYEPISFYYDAYVSYYEKYFDNPTATINYQVDLTLKPHGTRITSQKIYSATVTDIVKNTYGPASSASPEYIVRNIFTPSNYSSSSLRFLHNATPYYNVINVNNQLLAINQIPAAFVDSATVTYLSSTNPDNNVGDFGWIKLENSTPNTIVTSTNTKVTKKFATPNYQDLDLKISSKIYGEEKTRIAETSKIRSGVINDKINESPEFNLKNDVVVAPSQIKSRFVIPPGAVPIYVHLENAVVDRYTVDNSSGPYSGKGGVAQNRDLNQFELVPSSPNIIVSIANPDFATPHLHDHYIDVTGGSTYNYYFDSIKWPYGATPGHIIFSSQDGSAYPFKYRVWEDFSAAYDSTINYQISENGVVLSEFTTQSEELNNKQNDLIGIFTFDRDEFGLSQYETSPNLVIKSIEVINNDNDVVVWQENTYDNIGNINLNYFDSTIGKYRLKDIQFNAKYDVDAQKYLIPSLKSGWYYYQTSPNYSATEGYIYANKGTYTVNNDDTFTINSIARAGAPIIVSAVSDGSTINYKQVSFYEESTPSNLSHYNFEYIVAKNNYSIFLAYSDVFDVSIYDTFTGTTVIENVSSQTNEISLVSIPEQVPFVIGREYRVQYRVRNTYNVDHYVYNSNIEDYETQINLLSTPSSPYYVTVNFESSLYDKDIEIDNIYLNPIYNSIAEGFLYLSHDSYKPNHVDLYISPKQILDNGSDYFIATVFSKDINNNPKPHQTFEFVGTGIVATPQYVTTDYDGLGKAIIGYYGGPVSKTEINSIYINGISYPNTNAHQNSESLGLSATANYYIMPTIPQFSALHAEVDKKIITANGQERLNVYGKTKPGSIVYWRKSRFLPEALSMSYSASQATPGQNVVSGRVVSDNQGDFLIGPFVAQPDATPGYWFAVIDTEEVSSPSSNPVTISGDIVYWYEKYDSVQSDNQESVYIPTSNESSEYESYREDVRFKLDALTGSEYYDSESSTPWSLPKWYPVDRYTQYQIGYFGSTPNVIDNLSNLHRDFEEE